MLWLPLYYQIFTSRRWVGLSNADRGLWVQGFLWLMGEEEGDVIPTRMARTLGRQRSIDALVESGLWEAVEDGYLMHNFAEILAKGLQRKFSNASRQERFRISQDLKITRDKRVSNTGNNNNNINNKSINSDSPYVESESSISNTKSTTAKNTDLVFRAWKETLSNGDGRSLTATRKNKILQRLKRYPLEDVVDAVRGWQIDPWPDRVNQNDIAILLRSDEQCEKFRDLWRNGAPEVLTNAVDRDIADMSTFSQRNGGASHDDRPTTRPGIRQGQIAMADDAGGQ